MVLLHEVGDVAVAAHGRHARVRVRPELLAVGEYVQLARLARVRTAVDADRDPLSAGVAELEHAGLPKRRRDLGTVDVEHVPLAVRSLSIPQ